MSEYRRKLPHFHPEAAYLFVTWRLHGSLPVRRDKIVYPTPGHAFVAQDRALDHAAGPRRLNDPRIAETVARALIGGESEKRYYDLLAWALMPNHVHLLLLPKALLPVLTQWLKGSTAREANRILGRAGHPFWQEESYDQYLRAEAQMCRTVAYIEDSPVAAGLVSAPELWPRPSAGWKA